MLTPSQSNPIKGARHVSDETRRTMCEDKVSIVIEN